MFFWNVLLVKPFAALSMLVCLATIYSCISLKRGYVIHIADKFLIAFVGLLAAFQGLRIVQGAGLLTLPLNSTLTDLVDLMVAVLFFQAPMMLRVSCNDRLTAGFELRLAKAAPPKTSLPLPIKANAEPRDRDVSALEAVAWALPKLSDSAFKLYAYLLLRSDPATKRTSVNAEDLHQQLGRSLDELKSSVAELQKAGACSIRREDDFSEIEMNAQLAKLSAALFTAQQSKVSTAATEAL